MSFLCKPEDFYVFQRRELKQLPDGDDDGDKNVSTLHI